MILRMSAVAPQTQTCVTFEHPANEQIRLYLRLEHLFKTFHLLQKKATAEDSKIAVMTLAHIGSVTDRPDLKSKLVQCLTLMQGNLAQLGQSPNIDHNVLQQVVNQLTQTIELLNANQAKLGETLRTHDFINQVRLNLSQPAGLCEHHLHALQLWMQRPADERTRQLNDWYCDISALEKAINLLLSLTRQSTKSSTQIAEAGLYQLTQETHTPCALIRVTVPAEYGVYPEISANKHRVMIRFLEPSADGNKPKQTQGDIPFTLACCRT